MVTVVQLVEHQVVILGVAGSSPVSHPNDTNPGSFCVKDPGFRRAWTLPSFGLSVHP